MVTFLVWIFFLLFFVYFFVGISSYFLGVNKTIKYGLFSLALLVILVVLYIIIKDAGQQNIASAIALGAFILVMPLASFTIGILSANVAKSIKKSREPKI